MTQSLVIPLTFTYELFYGRTRATTLAFGNRRKYARAGGDARGKQSAGLIVVKKGGGFAEGDVFVDIAVEDHEEPVKEIGRIHSAEKKLFHCYGLLRELDQASGKEKLAAMDKVERYLENNEDRAYLDAWYALGLRQMELGMTEKAVSPFKKCLEISPKTIVLFRGLVNMNDLPKEILE